MIRPRKNKMASHGTCGSILLVTLLICLILGTLIASYLSLIQNQCLSDTRAQAWQAALVVAEAGIEEAMAHLNSGVSTNNLAVNSWVSLGGGIYQKTNLLGDSYSVVSIKLPPAVTNVAPVVTASAYVPGPLSRPNVSRTVQVTTRASSAMVVPNGMVVQTTINLNGSGIAIDSFDSSNPLYSNSGMYDPRKARDQAQVTTLSAATNAINISNAKIKGLVRTAPTGQVTIGANGSVGDAAWVSAGTQGIENGHLKDDADFTMPMVNLPNVAAWQTAVPGNYKINGVTYSYILNNLSPWKLSKLSGSLYISAPGVVLYVTDALTIGSGQQIVIGPGASLSLYVGAPSAIIGGNGVVNLGGRAKDFTYYGLPSNTAFGLQANASFTGYIEAPNALFTLGGGGNNSYDFVGGCVVNSVVMNGHFNFHYDESLASPPIPSGFQVISWDEL